MYNCTEPKFIIGRNDILEYETSELHYFLILNPNPNNEEIRLIITGYEAQLIVNNRIDRKIHINESEVKYPNYMVYSFPMKHNWIPYPQYLLKGENILIIFPKKLK